ncbi:hypothetical protein GCM10011494_24420 [Novosphingobium endophyticum]|uniref:Uncharacterized protein n=1 Tax=Novosphingobium endophyticum TaxID=1955250 RepID=A0A916X4X0_9SPHN|nr:DUF6771 family protein [Novosphingobium endophyticum]GGC04980.1 hypothetical protein GCM10011494_24420 [Novosphingobium endophyticum]
MDRIDETDLTEALLSAPEWARAGLTSPSAWMREDAARQLARTAALRMREARLVQNEQDELPL